jgi:hypothetical protein
LIFLSLAQNPQAEARATGKQEAGADREVRTG